MFKTRGGHYIIPVLKNTMMNPMLNSESPDHIEEGDEEAHLEQKDDSKSVEEEHDSDLGDDDIIDDDAEAVMLTLFAECLEDQEIWRLHEENYGSYLPRQEGYKEKRKLSWIC